MIIPDDEVDKKAPLPSTRSSPGTAIVTAHDQINVYTAVPDNLAQNDDHPPPYTASGAPGASAHNEDLPQRPCNWMYMRRVNGGIKETYTVDPALQVPLALLSDAASCIPESGRDNLNLHTNNGGINVTLRIIHGRVLDETKKRARIALHTSNGSVKANFLPSGETMPKFLIKASTSNGSIQIRVPRTFAGPISASTSWGSISLSSELEKHTTTFSDGNIKKCFVGDFSQYQDNKQEEWDELQLDTRHGSIRVDFVDEDNLNASTSGRGPGNFWARIFGL